LEIRDSPSNFDLQYSFTQNDELQYTKERLAETDEKLRHREENMARSLPSPQDRHDRKLEEATKQVAEAEKKLAEREEDLVQLYRFTEDLEMKHDVLEGNVIIHKKEAEDLRRQLAETQKELDDTKKQKVAAESDVAEWKKKASEKLNADEKSR
jgi:chromosome segregation ATPase